MNGFIKRTLAGAALGSGLISLSGCYTYRYLVDTCYPERYNYMARQPVLQTTGNQAYNGHVLDQTVWNYYFESDPRTGRPTAELNALGREHLTYLARRRPAPDPRIYLQTAQDVPYVAVAATDQLAKDRADLDSKRIESVQRYLHSQTIARNLGFDFQVTVHDPAEVGLPAIPIGGNQPATVYRVFGVDSKLFGNFQGVLPNNAGGGASTGGAGGGGGGGGGSAGGGSGGGGSGGGGAGAGP